MPDPDYREMYNELRDTLHIHHSHTHKDALRYARAQREEIRKCGKLKELFRHVQGAMEKLDA